MKTLLEHYRRLRAARFSPYGDRQAFIMDATSALSGARMALEADAIRREWDDEGGTLADSYDAKRRAVPGDDDGLVRIVCHPDESSSLEDLEGDTFNPRVNPEIKPEILAREREEFAARLERDGVWGLVAEYWNGAEWVHTDSIWGLVGTDLDHVDTDLMRSAMDGLAEHRERVARCIERSRPDMYAHGEG